GGAGPAVISTWRKRAMLAADVHRVFGSALEWTASYVQPAFRLMKKKKVEFSSHTGNLAPMRKFVRQFLDAYPFSEQERTFMVLGVDEGYTNVIRYAYHLRDEHQNSLSLKGLR